MQMAATTGVQRTAQTVCGCHEYSIDLAGVSLQENIWVD